MHPAHPTTDDISSPSPRSATDGGVTVKISLLTGSVICILSPFFLCKILAPCTMSSISHCKLNMPSHESASEQNCSHLSFCKRVHGKILKRKFRLLCASAVFPSSPTYHSSPKFAAQASIHLSYPRSFIPSAFAQIWGKGHKQKDSCFRPLPASPSSLLDTSVHSAIYPLCIRCLNNLPFECF